MGLVQRSRDIEGDDNAAAHGLGSHLTLTTTTLHRVLATTVGSLFEPRATDPMRAMRVLGCLIETLVGAATGAVIGQVVRAAVQVAGPEARDVVHARLCEALRRVGPRRGMPRVASLHALPAYVVDAAARPLVDELGARLHPRLGAARAEHETALRRIVSAIPAAHAASFTATLARLPDDDLVAHLWSEHLRVAWCAYAAAVSPERDATATVPAELANSECCATWQTWLRRVRGERPERAAVTAAPGEYIMAVM